MSFCKAFVPHRCVVVTCADKISLSGAYTHMPGRSGVLVPCISFLGVAGLPQRVYQCGFGTTAVLMALSIRLR